MRLLRVDIDSLFDPVWDLCKDDNTPDNAGQCIPGTGELRCFSIAKQNRAAVVLTTALFGGSGWESNPPKPALRRLSHGFEDRGAHQDSTAPV